jgi:ParB family chromosome partitioning protein
MNPTYDPIIRMIPIDQIVVLNPRLRGRVKFKQIVDNIHHLGLKKPVTVAQVDGKHGETKYLLVCGEGRLDAFRQLGQAEIPAIVIQGQRDDFLLMSLAENFARRKYAAIDLVKEIENLKARGYTYPQIAKKIDLNESYVRDILKLLQHGEARLLQAVLKEQIPLSVAVIISRSDDKSVQRALTEAYEKKELRGKALIRARRIIEDRRHHGKGLGRARKSGQNGVSANNILRAYERETTRQRIIIQKAKLSEARLLFLVSAIKKLFEDENFVNLLRAEGLDTVPQYLAAKLNGKCPKS